MSKEYVWALNENKEPCKCYAAPENRGRGKCHHFCHADKTENVSDAMKQLRHEQEKQEIFNKQITIQDHDKNHVRNEKNILAAFPVGEEVTINGKQYLVKDAGLPLVVDEGGNCKTDVYVKLQDRDGNEQEYKLSIKQTNYLYIENHMREHRIKSLFNMEAKDFSERALNNKDFEWKKRKAETKLSKDGKTLTIPFSYEYMLHRSDKMTKDSEVLNNIPRETLENIYAGSCLSKGKRDTTIGPDVIKDSGIANYYVMMDCFDRVPTADEVIKHADKLDDKFYEKHNMMGLQTKAVNIRVTEENGKFYSHRMTGTQLCRRDVAYNNGKMVLSNEIYPTGPKYITEDNDGHAGWDNIVGWNEDDIKKLEGSEKYSEAKWGEISENSILGKIIKDKKPSSLAELQMYITHA